jgi:ATP-dependent RNA helicase DDX46/PRP5
MAHHHPRALTLVEAAIRTVAIGLCPNPTLATSGALAMDKGADGGHKPGLTSEQKERLAKLREWKLKKAAQAQPEPEATATEASAAPAGSSSSSGSAPPASEKVQLKAVPLSNRKVKLSSIKPKAKRAASSSFLPHSEAEEDKAEQGPVLSFGAGKTSTMALPPADLDSYFSSIRSEIAPQEGATESFLANPQTISLEEILQEESRPEKRPREPSVEEEDEEASRRAFFAHLQARPSQEEQSEGAHESSHVAEIIEGDDDDATLFDGGKRRGDVPTKGALELLKERTAKRLIPKIDHSAIAYPSFRKRFLIESPEIAAMSDEEVEAERAKLQIQVRGRHCPRPVKTWAQAGLTAAVQRVFQQEGYEEPFAIQRQAIPAIMMGRDVIGIAKTGSGKTLAFLAPLLRHVVDQGPLEPGESGPIAMILAPTRELVTQIHAELRKFAKPLGLSTLPVYGGANIGAQVSILRAGVHVLVGTPGRTIELLALNGGRVMSTRRCTMLVVDEADRLFDLGFEPQIRGIASTIRPDRQVVMFSATFPNHVEQVAKTITKHPLEIVVGGKSMASESVEQFVEVRSEESKFPRLLQLLGAWWDRGSVLVFVSDKDRADDVLLQLLRVGYMGMSLHGGKDPEDRAATVADFKRRDTNLLIATSVACRGLDVKHLRVVINYDVPNHLEDYIHRIGRTGRAGKEGTAFTFITPEEAQFAPDLVHALTAAGQPVPSELKALSDAHESAVESGLAHRRRSGYATKPTIAVAADEALADDDVLNELLSRKRLEYQQGMLSTDELLVLEDEIETKRQDLKRAQANAARERAATTHGGSSSSKAREPITAAKVALLRAKAIAKANAFTAGTATQAEVNLAKAELAAAEIELQQLTAPQMSPEERAQAALRAMGMGAEDEVEGGEGGATVELDINDFPQQARRRVLSKEIGVTIAELFGCALTTKGVYIAPGKKPGPGQSRLTVLIEGPNKMQVRRAQAELRRILEEVTSSVGFDKDMATSGGKFSI